MDKVFRKLKKQNGEGFAKTIRNYHNGILEIPDILDIVKHAGRTKEDAENILSYLVSLLTQDDDVKKEPEDPFELLKKAGYDAYYADTLKKQNAIKKYFASGEELCTFRDPSRFENYYIVNAVHERAAKLKREDFRGKEKREDEYGTSVISIQIAKRGGFISIKNRYNHTVPGCDNTFKSNPDNIIEGLSAALANHFNVSFSNTSKVPEGYVLVGRRVVKEIMELNGVIVGERCYVKVGQLVEMGEHEYLFDHFKFDARTKLFEDIADAEDCFPEVFNRHYGGKPSVFVKNYCIYDGDTLLVGT